MAGIPFHPQQERPHLDVVLDNQYLVLKGTGPDVDPTTLSGHVRLVLTEPTSIKEITLQFKGKAKIPVLSSNSIINSSSHHDSHVVFNHDWSFLQGNKKHSHTLNAGRHLFPFHLEISGSLPSSLVSTSALGCASVSYKLRAVAVRPSFAHNLQAKAPVFILRSLTSEALEYQQTIEIENTWPEKLMYAIMLPHKAWAAGDVLTAIVKLSPLAKGVYVQAIDSSIVETTKILVRGGSREDTRVVASTRQEMMIDHKAVDIEMASSGSSATAASSSPLAALSSRSSRPGSPHFGSSSSYHPHPPSSQQQEQQEETEDLGFENNDIVTCINLSIPRSSAYPFLYSASDAASASSPITTPPRSSSSPTLTLLPFSTNASTSQPTSSSSTLSSSSQHPTVTPSHGLEPIFVSHRIKWIIFIHNKDGHVSELRCSLPIRILDGALLEESRGFTMRFRKLLLRTCGLGSVLSQGGEEGSEEGEDDGGAGVLLAGEEGRVRQQMEVDRELPSYPAHVRDRVANMFLSDTVTMLVSNPWVGKIGPSETGSGSGASASNTPESSGQRDSNIVSPLIPVVSASDPLAVSATQPDSRASRSGHNTPPNTQSSSQQQTHMPVMSNLLVNEAVRRIGDVPSSVGGQQQSQPHQHQHQTHDQHQQHRRTLRWVGSREGSRTTSPERSALSSATNNNNTGSDNNGPSISEGGSPNSVVSSGSSPGPGFASPFQNLFKATIKPFTALAGHHGHRPTHSLSRSTTSLMGLRSLSTAGTASDLSAGVTDSNNKQRSALLRSELYLSLTCSSSGGAGGQNFSSSSPAAAAHSPAPQNEMMNNDFISDSPCSSPSLAAANGVTAPSMSSLSSDSSRLESSSASAYPSSHTSSTSTSSSASASASASPLSHTISRAFSLVPDYSIASRGFIGGIPPLSSMRGLPSYEEAEAQRREREAVTQPQNQVVDEEDKMKTTKLKMKMKERGSMSEPDLAGRFGHVRFESGMQAVAENEAGTSHTTQRDASGGAHDGEDDDDEDDTGAGPIQMRIKARP